MTLPCSSINIDHSYQRPLSQTRLRKLSPFNPTLCLQICVNQRADGSYWAMDGQHRLFSAIQDGHQFINCAVFHVEHTYEALYWVIWNTTVKPPSSTEKFKAELNAGNPIATDINRIVTEHNFIIAAKGTVSQPRQIVAVRALYTLYRPQRAHADEQPGARLHTILRVIGDAWGDESYAATGEMLLALNRLLIKNPGRVEEKHLIERLRPLDPRHLMAEGRTLSRMSGINRVFGLALLVQRQYNRGRRAAYRLGENE